MYATTTIANTRYSHGLLEFVTVNVDGSGKMMSGSPNRQTFSWSSSLRVMFEEGVISIFRSSEEVRTPSRLSQIKEYAVFREMNNSDK